MTPLPLDDKTTLSIFDRMLIMRYVEEAVLRLYQERRFASHYHLYIGQEATGAAMLEALGKKDLICTTHRNHGHLVGRGSDTENLKALEAGMANLQRHLENLQKFGQCGSCRSIVSPPTAKPRSRSSRMRAPSLASRR